MSKIKFMSEGGSSNRPPLFEGTDYYYWKGKMELFLQPQDNDMWTIVENGNYIPYDEDLNVKKKEDRSEEEGKRMLLNFKAKLFLIMALSREEYDRVQECKNAKEIWDTLKIHHEKRNKNRHWCSQICVVRNKRNRNHR